MLAYRDNNNVDPVKTFFNHQSHKLMAINHMTNRNPFDIKKSKKTKLHTVSIQYTHFYCESVQKAP